MNYVIGIDHGNGNMKTENTVFPCGFAPQDIKPDTTYFATDFIEYDGRFYALSKERAAYTTDKTKTKDAFILTLFAIAKEIITRAAYGKSNFDMKRDFSGFMGKDVILAVGLPPSHIEKQAASFKEYFFNYAQGTQHSIAFKYNDKPFQFYLKDVLVLPQDYAAAIVYAGDYIEDYPDCYCVDIGDGTVDVVGLVDGVPEKKRIYSFEEGMSSLRTSIKASIINDYGANFTLTDKNVEDYFKGKKLVLPRNVEAEILAKIEDMAKTFTTNLINELHRRGVNLTVSAVIFCGGGAQALKKYLQEFEANGTISYPTFIDDVNANAVGYQQIAKMQLGVE